MNTRPRNRTKAISRTRVATVVADDSPFMLKILLLKVPCSLKKPLFLGILFTCTYRTDSIQLAALFDEIGLISGQQILNIPVQAWKLGIPIIRPTRVALQEGGPV